jgi:hypothetical protein
MSWTLTPPFTKYTDFTCEITVANLVPTAITDPNSPLLAKEIGNTNIANLDSFILKYEKILLKALLGTAGYAAFLVELAKASPNTKDQALYNMLFVDGKPVADFIYYWYMRDKATLTTGAGEAAAKLENAERVNNNNKMCQAWNEFSELLDAVVDYLEAEEAYFGCVAAGVDYTELLDTYRPINTNGI